MTALTISPEGLEVANAYLQYGDVKTVAYELEIPQHEVVRQLQLTHVKKYLDGVYLDLGYRNRTKLASVLDKVIDAKLEEAEETGIYSSKDLIDILQLAHKLRMDEIKLQKEEKTIDSQTNIQVNQYGDSSYGKLMERLLEKK
jgi:hypothetical protein